MISVEKVNVVAEFGSVHDGSFGNALKMIDLAYNVGANTAKFQTHIAEFESSPMAPNPKYFSSETRFEYFKRLEFTQNQWRELSEYCKFKGLLFSSSVFSEEACEVLLNADVDIIKIPSGEITNRRLLRYLSSTPKPLLLSTGMSNWAEIDSALEILNRNDVVVMQCTSLYPCELENIGLNVLKEMEHRYNLTVGFSDHSQSLITGALAVAAGAKYIEKHLTFSRGMYGSDASLALEPDEFRKYVEYIRQSIIVSNTIINKDDIEKFSDMRVVFQKSAHARRDLRRGQILVDEDIIFLKPSTGIKPNEIELYVGAKIKSDINKYQAIMKEFFCD